MNISEIENKWRQYYDVVPQQLLRIAEVKTAATAFNTNIDAVLRINGSKIAQLAEQVHLSAADLASEKTKLDTPCDVVRGIVKCFTAGIAEEWIAEDAAIYAWMRDNLGYQHLQMGGQGGIVANILAVSGVKKVVVHTSSHPRLQAEQFLSLDNLLGFSETGELIPAYKINREQDVPLIHWIIEFAKDDSFDYLGKTYVCPKANRFIATYDPANMVLKTDNNFIKYLNEEGFEYLILSGYHNLTSALDGDKLVRESANKIRELKRNHPQSIIHLELASTQDKLVRTAILEEIAPLADSIGLNDREALDALEIVDHETFKQLNNKILNVEQLFEILYILERHLNVPRIQLHMFGLYITLQKPRSFLTAEQNLRGMMLAATVAATKAFTGKLEKYEELLSAKDKKINVSALCELARYLKNPSLAEMGKCSYNGYEIMAVPAIIIEKPKTLVGMGDTISSLSLVGAR